MHPTARPRVGSAALRRGRELLNQECAAIIHFPQYHAHLQVTSAVTRQRHDNSRRARMVEQLVTE